MNRIVTTFPLFFLPLFLSAQDKKLTFQDHVQPLLKEKCAACHNNDKKQGGFNLSTYSAMMEGGGRGKAVEPGDPENSPLYLLMAHKEQPHMPPKTDKLPEKDLQLVANWIKGGALENSGSKADVAKPKTDLAVKKVVRGKPEGPPPMPEAFLAIETPFLAPRGTAVLGLAASPWAPLLAVAGQKCVLLYHTDTHDLIGILPFPEGQVNVLKFSRNGSLLIAAGGRSGQSGKVAVFDVKTGNRVATVGDEHDAILAADISPDQTQIALGTSSKLVRILSTSDGSQLFQLKKHTDWVTSIEYSPDGVLLASADRSGGLTIWETPTGQEYQTLRGPQVMVTEVTWRADGNVLACIAEDGQVRFFEMENGRQIRAFAAHGGGGSSVRFHHDGRLVTVGRDRTPKLWKPDGNLIINFPAVSDVGLRAVVSHDGNKAFVSDWTGMVSAFSTKDGKAAGQLSSVPPALEARLSEAAKRVETSKANEVNSTKALQAAQETLNKVNAETTAVKKQISDLTAQQKTLQDAIARITSDGGYKSLQAAIAESHQKEAATARLMEAVNKAKEAADQLKQNAELAAFAVQAQALLQKHQTELGAAKTYVQQMTATTKPLQDKLVQTQTELNKITPALQAASAQLAPKEAQLKAVQTSLAQVQAQANVVKEELKNATSALSRLQKAIEDRKQNAAKSTAVSSK